MWSQRKVCRMSLYSVLILLKSVFKVSVGNELSRRTQVVDGFQKGGKVCCMSSQPTRGRNI
jgi:hypothetical protein